MKFEYEIKENDLSRKIYEFWYDRNCLILDNFYVQARTSKKHQWKTVSRYSRLIRGESKLKEEDVLLDDHLKKDVMHYFLLEIQKKTEVVKWSQVKNK